MGSLIGYLFLMEFKAQKKEIYENRSLSYILLVYSASVANVANIALFFTI